MKSVNNKRVSFISFPKELWQTSLGLACLGNRKRPQIKGTFLVS